MSSSIIDKTLYPISLVLVFSVFIYSGVHKMASFKQNCQGLSSKMRIKKGSLISKLGMSAVIILEVFVTLFILSYLISYKFLSPVQQLNPVHKPLHWVSLALLCLYALFMVIVTFMYHLPNKKIGATPFLSHLSILGGILMVIVLVVKSNPTLFMLEERESERYDQYYC